MSDLLCICGSGRPSNPCCDPLLNGTSTASGAEALMRSRYAAYCLKNFEYLVQTTDPQRRFDFDAEATRRWMLDSTFMGLEVLKTSQDGNKAVVEFRARYQVGDQPEQVHHEVARFRKQAGRWFFRPR